MFQCNLFHLSQTKSCLVSGNNFGALECGAAADEGSTHVEHRCVYAAACCLLLAPCYLILATYCLLLVNLLLATCHLLSSCTAVRLSELDADQRANYGIGVQGAAKTMRVPRSKLLLANAKAEEAAEAAEEAAEEEEEALTLESAADGAIFG